MKRYYDNSLRDHLKHSVSMRRVLEMLNMEPPNRDGKIRSIVNTADKTPSLHIYEDHWYDFSTGQYGDQIEFIKIVKECSYGEALQILSGERNPGKFRRRKVDTQVSKIEDLTQQFESEPEGSELAIQRAAGFVAAKWEYLTVEDIIEFGVKVSETELWIPHRDKEGVVRGIKIRDITSGAKYAVTGSRFTNQLYRIDTHSQAHIALLAEGESDLWCLVKWLNHSPYKSLVQGFALPSGAAAWNDEFKKELLDFDTVILMLDDDQAGTAASEKIINELGHERTGKLIAPGGRVAEAIDDADQWLGKVLDWCLHQFVGVRSINDH